MTAARRRAVVYYHSTQATRIPVRFSLGTCMKDLVHARKPAATTLQKALEVNLNPLQYGSIVEIGAGQEVARNFFQAGGASGTIAQTSSAYDMRFSDAIYGPDETGRYVTRHRLQRMLEREFELVVERVSEERDPESCYFAFADTVSAKRFGVDSECHGWLGLRFQHEPGAEPSQVVLHVLMLDSSNLGQQTALGTLGVNLIHSTFKYLDNVDELVSNLNDNLGWGRIDIDYIHFDGPCFDPDANRAMPLKLVTGSEGPVVMFEKDGSCAIPGDLLYRKIPLILRGSFRPFTHVHANMIEYGREALKRELGVGDEDIVVLCEMNVARYLYEDVDEVSDLRARVDMIAGMGYHAMVHLAPALLPPGRVFPEAPVAAHRLRAVGGRSGQHLRRGILPGTVRGNIARHRQDLRQRFQAADLSHPDGRQSGAHRGQPPDRPRAEAPVPAPGLQPAHPGPGPATGKAGALRSGQHRQPHRPRRRALAGPGAGGGAGAHRGAEDRAGLRIYLFGIDPPLAQAADPAEAAALGVVGAPAHGGPGLHLDLGEEAGHGSLALAQGRCDGRQAGAGIDGVQGFPALLGAGNDHVALALVNHISQQAGVQPGHGTAHHQHPVVGGLAQGGVNAHQRAAMGQPVPHHLARVGHGILSGFHLFGASDQQHLGGQGGHQVVDVLQQGGPAPRQDGLVAAAPGSGSAGQNGGGDGGGGVVRRTGGQARPPADRVRDN